jgi:DNA-binding NarL/FixJ family response regulator
MIQIVVYSNQPILVRGLESLIDADPAFELQATCLSVPALREQLANNKPGLAVLDLTADLTSTTLRELQNLAPDCKLLLWTDTIVGDFAVQALTIGVRGVLRKTLSLDLQGTVKVYLSHLFQKSGAKDRFDLALQGVRNLSMAGISTNQAGLTSLVSEPAYR